MKRGEIYYADLNPTKGSEINKVRPVLIVSNNANNRASETVTVLPLTSNVKKVYPFEVELKTKDSGLKKASKVQAQQIRTLSKTRLESRVGKVGVKVMGHIEGAIRLHLDF